MKPKPLHGYAQINDSLHFQPLSFFEIEKDEDLVMIEDNTYTFQFLNLSNSFLGEVDWNFDLHGKLWNYNLQYMDWLKQKSLGVQQRKDLANSLYKNLWEGRLLLEPYPASLRIMNGIRFLSANEDNNLASYIKAEANFLTSRLEYHLLANHLLENAFAVYMAGAFFKEKQWIALGEKIIKTELIEQILEDGAHFELSPMYHQIIFFRVLEFLTYESPDSTLFSYVKERAIKMLSWLKAITFRNGAIPYFNDSTDGIALTSWQLFQIAEKLGLNEESNHTLKDSGYRKFKNDYFELIMDVHGISPRYQPGHAHADTFSFCLNYKDQPIIVDTGISTYNISERRNHERSTPAHNTLSINNDSSCEIWSGFRVGKRLKVKILQEGQHLILASHNGFKKYGVDFQRQVNFENDRLQIEDKLISNSNFKGLVRCYLHFHPTLNLKKLNEFSFIINNELKLFFDGIVVVKIEEYDFCLGFNSIQKGKRIVIDLKETKLITTLSLLL